MYILPAIDMIDGEPVRLYQGDYQQKEIVADDIVETAKMFEEAGAEWLHMVDLDGAKKGSMSNQNYVEEVKKNTNLKVEIGGGIRSLETITSLIEKNVDRIILGTSAIEDEQLLQESLRKYQEKIAVGVDMLDGEVKVSGWLRDTGINYQTFIEKMESLGVSTIIVTDISKDGAMQGTNLSLYETLQNQYDVDIIASGGVSSLDDVKALSDNHLYGAIIGKALYNGQIDLKEALKVAGG